MERFIIPEDASDVDEIEPLNSDTINKFDCELGEEIEFDEKTQKIKGINNRVCGRCCIPIGRGIY